MRRSLLLAALLLAASPALAQRPPAASFQPAEDDPANYPDAPGRDTAFGFCSACHGFKLVAAQGMTRAQWDEALGWMAQRHNMPPVEGEFRDIILRYLAQAFPPRAQPGWRNPFAAP